MNRWVEDREKRDQFLKDQWKLERKKKKEEEEKEAKLREEQMEKKREEIKKREQEKHDRRQAEYHKHFKKIRKYQKKHKDILEATPMFEKLEEQYKEKFVLPEIHEREKILKSIHEFKKPIDHEELEQHQWTYSVQRKTDMAEKQKWAQDLMKEWEDSYNMKHLSSRYQQILKEEKQRQREIEEEAREFREKLVWKKEKYASMVKETHKPLISQKKKLEMDFLKKSIEVWGPSGLAAHAGPSLRNTIARWHSLS